jgi:L,D-peptidoglycan transpeptidase YkuD (ErfK/YbiS/YcfS/YnhG family)
VEVVGEEHLAERVRGIESARASAEAAAALALQEAATRAAEAQAAAELAAAEAAAAEAAARAAAASAKPAPAPARKPTPKPAAPPAPAPPPGGISPAEIPSLAPAAKALVVAATRYGTSYATATAWQRDASGGWQVAYGPVPARLGWNGFAENRVRNSGTTPVGVFSLGTAFGPGGNPGTSLPWRQFDADDWWVYDPADPPTFNTWQRGRAPDALWSVAEAERLVDYGTQYAYAAVINFNIPVVSTRSGGGIFLHVNGSGATAGCVSLRAADMLNVLRWLDGSARVAMGPVAALRGR